ncbi:MAG: hypothetical protein WDM71_02275 [Ferruginibacter sp.]
MDASATPDCGFNIAATVPSGNPVIYPLILNSSTGLPAVEQFYEQLSF